MKRCISLLLCGLAFCGLIKAQEPVLNEGDSIVYEEVIPAFPDSLLMDSVEVAKVIQEVNPHAFKPDPNKAVMYAAIFPGLGQIYNRKYWKLPIVYGGFLGCYYAISWNNTTYQGYKNAFNDFMAKKPEDDKGRWQDYVPNNYRNNIESWEDLQNRTGSDATWFANSVLKNRRDQFRRYRDLSIIVSVGVYLICIVDAYVDAELFNFDISEDLGFRVEPVYTPRTSFSPDMIGFRCNMTF